VLVTLAVMESPDLVSGLGFSTRLETHFCESRSWRFQVLYRSQSPRLQVSVTSLLFWDFEYSNDMA